MMKAMSMMVTFIHHGPRSLATIRETGLPGDRGRLEPVTEIVLFPPNSYELIPSFSSSKLPNAIGAVSITIGLQVAQASHLASSWSSLLRAISRSFVKRKMPCYWGTAVDELIRYHPTPGNPTCCAACAAHSSCINKGSASLDEISLTTPSHLNSSHQRLQSALSRVFLANVKLFTSVRFLVQSSVD
jgi:hypothetical protein